MCQAYEAERRFIVANELAEIREAARKHLSGEAPLTREQLIELTARKLMLEEN